MANDMQDNALLTEISGGDLVAVEAKYHFSCLSEYRNRHRSYLCKKSKEVDTDYERVKARAFAEVVSYVEAAIEDKLYMFKVKELRCLYQKRLKEFGYAVEINKSKFKESILDYFESSGIKEQLDGKNKILIFSEGIKSLLKNAFDVHDYQEEALLFARVAKICRNELFIEENASFEGKFASNCQQLVPTIRLLISMILYGPDLNTAVQETQVCNTVSQILMYNAKKRKQKEDSESSRDSLKREPPVPLYVGLNIHTLTRNKGIIDRFEKLGLSVPSDRVLQVERVLAQNLCKQFREENILCPLSLPKELYNGAAIDNIDHNPSSTTATGSLHGTAISIMQHVTMENPGETREIKFHKGPFKNEPFIPDDFAVVPAVSLNHAEVSVPKVKITENKETLKQELIREKMRVEYASKLLDQELVSSQNTVSWAAYHESQQQQLVNIPAITVLLPLFFLENRHSSYGQHGTYGEHKMTIMLGGLHVENALCYSVGDLLAFSGWTEALTDADVATSGTADSFLKASHITRTRHAHQVTALALSKLQQNAFASSHSKDFEACRLKMIKDSPTFHYWDLILKTEVQVLIFIQAHREGNFPFYIESLESLMYIFFALDHYNYSRWTSIHLKNMKSLPDCAKETFEKLGATEDDKQIFSHTT